jgi:ankyrin repeat protein
MDLARVFGRRRVVKALGAGLVAALGFLGAAKPGFAQTVLERLLIATEDNDIPYVRSALGRGMPVDTVDKAGNSLLMIAARFGRLELAKQLIDLKANINHRNAFGDTPLMTAALGGNLDIARLLIDRGVPVNQPGWTALHYCAASGKADMCQLLLDRDADIDARSPNGTTPLMMAVREGHFDVVKLLIWEVADVNARNSDGATALKWAIRSDRDDMVKLLKTAGAKD